MDHKAVHFRIKDGAYEEMARILRFPEVTGPSINGQLCRITASHDVLLSIKSNFWPEYQNDQLMQVRLLNDNSRDFVVMQSLMEPVAKEAEEAGWGMGSENSAV